MCYRVAVYEMKNDSPNVLTFVKLKQGPGHVQNCSPLSNPQIQPPMTDAILDLPSEQYAINLDDVIIPDRLRKEYGDLDGLAQSISDKGLIQPIVLNRESDGTFSLLAGGRRTAALKLLGQSRIVYGVHFVYKTDLPADVRLELEVEENIQRLDMTWQERVDAIWKIHSLKVKVASEQDIDWGHEETGALCGMKRANVQLSIQVAKAIAAGNEQVAAAGSVREALGLLLKQKEDATMRKLASIHVGASTLASTKIEDEVGVSEDGSDPNELPAWVGDAVHVQNLPEATDGEVMIHPKETVAISKMFLNVNCLEWLSEQPDDSLKVTTLTDPPFAIDMDMIQQDGGGMNIESVRETHNVDDNLSLLDTFLKLLYKKTTSGNYAVLFCDAIHFAWLVNKAASHGWKVQRWPLVWVKSHQCQNMAAQYNFTKATEFAIVMRKGDATLVNSASRNWIEVNGLLVKKDIPDHPFVKPPELWQWIADKVALKGSTIYDPFAGRNSGPLALLRQGYKVLANEIDEDHYNAGIVGVADFYRSINPNIQFS